MAGLSPAPLTDAGLPAAAPRGGGGAPPRVLLDANVLLPRLVRELLLGAAALGALTPLWSARILEEWARAARRLPGGLAAEAEARAEVAAVRAAWPLAEVPAAPELEAQLALPDAADLHVLAAALSGRAALLLTWNRRDFPARTLARHGLMVREPDTFLRDLFDEGWPLGRVALAATGSPPHGAPRPLRGVLRRAGLPRLARALERAG